MVGVPRSSGCRICVQRRVKCDGARPTCNNCRKGNRPCPGYGPGVKFHDEGPKLREKFHNGQWQSSSPESDSDSSVILFTSKDYTPRDPWGVRSFETNEETLSSHINVLRFVEGKIAKYENVDLGGGLDSLDSFVGDISDLIFGCSKDSWSMMTSPILSPQAQQLQLLANFTSSITPPETKFLPKSMRAQTTWLSQLPALCGTTQLLDSAIRAVTLVHIGRLHNNEKFVLESRPHYGKALKLLTVAVTDKEMGLDNRTLCATILLSFYEMFASDSDASWIRHAGGAGALMQMRGPKRHRYGLDRDVFVAYRHTLVIEAFSNDVPSFLNEPEWRQLSRDIYNDLLKSGRIPANRIAVFDVTEDFYGEMAEISAVSAKACQLAAKADMFGIGENYNDILDVCQQFQKNRDTLKSLIIRWRNCLDVLGLHPPLKPSDDPIVPYQYQYTNVFIASLYVGLYTTLMLVNVNLCPLLELLGRSTTTIEDENQEYAMQACRSVEFMLTSSFLGPFFAIYALRHAFRAFQPGDIRKDWALCKLVEIGDRRMMFAKGEILGQRFRQRPDFFYQGAKERLDRYLATHKVQVQVPSQDSPSP